MSMASKFRFLCGLLLCAAGVLAEDKGGWLDWQFPKDSPGADALDSQRFHERDYAWSVHDCGVA